jgi:hypothetical protein
VSTHAAPSGKAFSKRKESSTINSGGNAEPAYTEGAILLARDMQQVNLQAAAAGGLWPALLAGRTVCCMHNLKEILLPDQFSHQPHQDDSFIKMKFCGCLLRVQTR